MTMDDYLAARPITTPFGLLDCDVPCDGAVAVDRLRRRPAGDLASPPVHVEAVGTQITERASCVGPGRAHPRAAGPRPGGPPVDPHRRSGPTTSTWPSSTTASPSTASRGSRPSASAASARRRTSSTAARTSPSTACCPLNTHGGQLSAGRLHGMGLVHEADRAAPRRGRRPSGRRRRHRRRHQRWPVAGRGDAAPPRLSRVALEVSGLDRGGPVVLVRPCSSSRRPTRPPPPTASRSPSAPPARR